MTTDEKCIPKNPKTPKPQNPAKMNIKLATDNVYPNNNHIKLFYFN